MLLARIMRRTTPAHRACVAESVSTALTDGLSPISRSAHQRAQDPVVASAPVRITLLFNVAPGDELRTTVWYGLGLK